MSVVEARCTMGRVQRNPSPCGDCRSKTMGFTSFNPSYGLRRPRGCAGRIRYGTQTQV